MKITIGQIAADTFMSCLEKLILLELDMMSSFQLAASIAVLVDKKATYLKVRQGLFTKFGHIIPANGDIPEQQQIKEEHMAEFFKKMEELNNIEFTIALENPIKLPNDCKFKPIDLYPILTLIAVG